MGRKAAEIPEDILADAQENPEKIPEIAKEVGVSEKTVKNRIKKVKLQTSFIKDESPEPALDSFQNDVTEPTEKQPLSAEQYDAVAKSTIWMLDGMCMMGKNIGNILLKSKGKELDFEPLSNQEKEFMVTQLKSQPETLQYLANNDFMMPMLAFGSILATIVMHFKVKDIDEDKDKKKITKKEIQVNKENKIAEKTVEEKLSNLKVNVTQKNLQKVSDLPDARTSKINDEAGDFLD